MPEFSENKSQSMAIRHFRGPALVLAGPGSGKTYTIVKRIQYLIQQHKIEPSKILVVTFTRAAAGEMKERFLSLMGQPGRGVQFATFHACFYSILRRYYHPQRLSLLDEQEKRLRVQEALRQYERERGQESAETGKGYGEVTPELLEEVLQELSRYKNDGRKMSAYEPLFTDKERLIYIWQTLERYKQAVHKIDFDDMAIKCYMLFKGNPELLKHWQEAFSFILVDEFQDINEMQYRVLCMLAGEKKNLFVVGDDDQSIYGFRGAKPAILRRFAEDFAGCARIMLEYNYRCNENIIKASGLVIGQNKDRMAKHFKAVREAGAPVRIREFADRQEETDFLMQEFLHIMEQQKREADMLQLKDARSAGGVMRLENTAVIFRTNREMADFATHLMRHHIPFSMRETGRSMFDTAVAKDIRAYLRFAQGERTRRDFYQIMNRPLRYISRDMIKEPLVDLPGLLHDCERYYPGLAEAAEKLLEDMERMKTLQPYAAIVYLRRGVGYDEYIRTLPEAEEKLLLADQIQESAREYKTLSEWERSIEEYTAKLAEAAKSSARSQEEKPGLRLMTMHASKGLEYGSVYLPHLNEGVIPHKKSSEDAALLEEERRMLYVSMTRAKDRLCLTYVQDKQKAASRFLEPLFEKQ